MRVSIPYMPPILFPHLPMHKGGRRPDEFRLAMQSQSQQQHCMSKSILKSRYMPPTSKTYSTKMPRYLPPSVFVTICIFSLSDAFVPANKITPAEPPVGAKCTLARGSSRSSTTSAALNAKKKKTAPAASSKIQVKMLKHVEGTGHVRVCFRHLLMRHLLQKLQQFSSHINLLISQHCHIFSKETW